MREKRPEQLQLLKEDLPLPLMVLKEEAIHGNAKWMQSYAEKAG